MGLPVPADFEGRVPPGLFEADWLAAHPMVQGPAASGGAAPAAAQAPAASSTEEEQREEMLAQLRLLGYIED
jgi:hypothetical protein